VFENSLLRRIFELKGDEMAGGWRRLHNEDLHNLYASRNIIRVIKKRKTGRKRPHGRMSVGGKITLRERIVGK
jgi:hypothetical protein